MEKCALVQAALSRRDAGALAVLAAEPGGLCNDELRRDAWLVLLGDALRSVAGDKRASELLQLDHRAQMSPRSRRAALVGEFGMDIERSMFHFSKDRSLKPRKRLEWREKLTRVIAAVLTADQSLHYYQGFHDVCTVHLHVAGGDVALATKTSLLAAKLQFADHHRSDFGTTIEVMKLLQVILEHFDPEVAALLSEAEVRPHFALSWLLTGFAHVVEDFEVVARIFDAILASHPMFPLYLCVAIILRPMTRARLMKLAEKDASMPALHHFLQNVAPPCAPITSGRDWKKRKKKYHHQNDQALKLAKQRGTLEGLAYFVESKAEEEENCVDNLVASALEMLADFPPFQVIRKSEDPVPVNSAVRIPVMRVKPWGELEKWGREYGYKRKSASKPFFSSTSSVVSLSVVVFALAYAAQFFPKDV